MRRISIGQLLSGLAVLALASSWPGLAACASPSERLQVDSTKLIGKPAPSLQVNGWINTNGKPLALKSLKGKVVLVDFWAFW